MIRILIAEDQAMLLTTLATILNLEDDIEVIHQAADGQQALDFLTADQTINLVISDIEMPHMTGIELAQALQEMNHPAKVVILTTFARSGYLRRAMDAGVKGYLLKDSPAEDLLKAIKRVMNGQRSVAPELMQEAWDELDPLTEKERKALKLAQQGDSTEAISEKLHLSEGTVRNYLSSASAKLGATNRIEAARIAQQKGWL